MSVQHYDTCDTCKDLYPGADDPYSRRHAQETRLVEAGFDWISEDDGLGIIEVGMFFVHESRANEPQDDLPDEGWIIFVNCPAHSHEWPAGHELTSAAEVDAFISSHAKGGSN